MADPRDRRDHNPQGIFDVRDHFREQQRGDGLAATVSGQVRFAVEAVVTPNERIEPQDWMLDTGATLSGLSVFLDRVVEGRRPPVLRKLPPAAASVEVRVSCARFQPKQVAFQPGSGQRVQVDLAPAVDYPFDTIALRPDEHGPTLLRGSVRDATGQGVPDSQVTVAQGIYPYRTDRDGTWVIVLPDTLPWVAIPGPAEGLAVTVQVTLIPTATWQTAQVLPDPGGGVSWTRNGLVMTCALTAVRGTTLSVPELRLQLS
jgi:hypothetical protein